MNACKLNCPRSAGASARTHSLADVQALECALRKRDARETFCLSAATHLHGVCPTHLAGGFARHRDLAATNAPSPDQAFDREWALALLAKVIGRLEKECAADGKAALFAQLKMFLTAGGGDLAQGAVAKALGMEEGAVRVEIHRLRKRYRALLRDEIAQTLADGSPVEEELRALFGAFA